MRRRLLVGGCLAAVILVVLLLRTMTPGHRIGQHGFDRIELGMTEAEVIAILGVQAGNYQTRDDLAFCDVAIKGVGPYEGLLLTQKQWDGDAACICVWFEAERVRSATYYEARQRGTFARLQAWLSNLASGER